MKERPILFSAPMVRAILAGTKTQTRRAMKLKPWHQIEERDDGSPWPWMHDNDRDADHWLPCPYGQPGDRLWVREGHYLHGIWSVQKNDAGKRYWTFHPNPDMGVQFTEPNGFIKGRSTTVAGWYRRPSIHMPRWASRITLEVAGVRVERLQTISNDDIKAEGLDDDPRIVSGEIEGSMLTPVGRLIAFQDLWESINGPESWEANPWVWVVEFKRLEVQR